MNFVTLVPFLLKLGGLFLIFGAGWYAKGVLVENAELKQLKEELKKSNAKSVRFLEENTAIKEKLNGIRLEFEKNEEESCNGDMPPCIKSLLNELQRGREN